MATVVRLKRKRTDEPIENLCIDLKRSKSNDGNSRILRLAATIDSKEELSLEKTLSFLEESRKKQRSVSSTPQTPARVSRKRQLQITATDSISTPAKQAATGSSEIGSSVQIYDLESKPTDPLWCSVNTIEDTITCNGEPLISERSVSAQATASLVEDDYVFDVFFMDQVDGEEFSHQWLEEALLYEAFEEGYSDFGAEYRQQSGEYSDDSNAEDNWRNDYPDEDSSDDDCDSYSERRQHRKDVSAVNSLFDGRLKIASDEEDSDLSEIEEADDPSFERYYKSYKKQYGITHRNSSGDYGNKLDDDDDEDSDS